MAEKAQPWGTPRNTEVKPEARKGPRDGDSGPAMRRGDEGKAERGARSESSEPERRASERSESRNAEAEHKERKSQSGHIRSYKDSNTSDKAKADTGKSNTDKLARTDNAADKTKSDADMPDRMDKSARDNDQRTDRDRNQAKGNDKLNDADKQASGKPESPERVKKVDLSDDRKGRIRDAFRQEHDLKPRRDVNVQISVGRRLPRDWEFRRVPIGVVEIVPEYRDYDFVLVDGQYVICDPDTYEIVAVIPANGGQYAGGAGSERCPASLRLSRDERELILESARSDFEVDVGDLEIGSAVPANVDLQRFDDRVVSMADELSACRYFVARDQLAIVDPREERVVLVIDKG